MQAAVADVSRWESCGRMVTGRGSGGAYNDSRNLEARLKVSEVEWSGGSSWLGLARAPPSEGQSTR